MEPSMYKSRKKRVMSPDIPRPNLFSHEKTIKEQAVSLAELSQYVDELRRKEETQNMKIRNLENTVSSLLRILNKR